MGRFEEIQRLFDEASELDSEAREAYLRDIQDGGVREEVRVLLESDTASERGEFMAIRPDAGVRKMPEPGGEFGPYLIVRELGRGGTGAVFLARDRVSDREFALKILHPLLWTSEESRAQLMHEAGVAARLQHPSIVGLHGVEEVEGWTVLVYQYVEGGSLADEIRAFHQGDRDGRWRIQQDAVRDLLPVLEGLTHAHEQGIWHRDLKPSNILFEDGGGAYVADFGLAKDSMDGNVTMSGIFKGSVRYMSPEQARARLRLVDQRSDVFSFGLVLFEALSGEHAFAAGGSEAEMLERIAHGKARFLYEAWPDAPEALSAICYRALRPAPEDRYQSAADLATDLRAALDDQPVSARLPDWRDKTKAFVERRRVPIAISSLAVLAVTLGIVALVIDTGPPTVPVTIESTAEGHEVLVQEFDETNGDHGPARSVGLTPVSAQLPEGAYRFTVVAPGSAFAELARVIHTDDSDAGPVYLDANPRPIDAVNANMVRIDRGPFIAGDDMIENYPRREETIANPYWIDRYEVTNSEFVEFLRATGRENEAVDSIDLDLYGDHPVTRVTWSEAMEYAEWAGKRLPTAEEWERAARGTDGRKYPWGDEPVEKEALERDVCVGRGSMDDYSGTYRQSSEGFGSPVGAHTRDMSPDGVFDVFGNVAEFVENRPTIWNDGVVSVSDRERTWKGLGWRMPGLSVFSLGWYGTTPEGSRGKNDMIGFRCAKSAAPVKEAR